MTEPRSQWRFPRIPAPLQRLFDRFPLVTYPPNDLPSRSPAPSDLPTLYVFISERDALRGLPSFNPSCLKWQTFLKIAGVQFHTVSSTNHASPTGALPFLLPARTQPPSGTAVAPLPIPSHRLAAYAAEHGTVPALDGDPDTANPRQAAYQALLDHRIRNAWLHTLYLTPANTALLSRLYVDPTSTSAAVRAALLHQLRRAAEAEILRSATTGGGSPDVEAGELYARAREAFAALATLLESSGGYWFSGSAGPGLFDAAVFAYTHLLLDEGMGWPDGTVSVILGEFPSLVQHRERLFERCWGEAETGRTTPTGMGMEESAYVKVER